MVYLILTKILVLSIGQRHNDFPLLMFIPLCNPVSKNEWDLCCFSLKEYGKGYWIYCLDLSILYGKCDRVTPMIVSDSILTDWEILLACLMKWVAMMEKFSRQETVTLSRTWKQLPVNSQQKAGAFRHAIAKEWIPKHECTLGSEVYSSPLEPRDDNTGGLLLSLQPCENTSTLWEHKVPSQARLRNLTCRNYEIRNIYCFKLSLW